MRSSALAAHVALALTVVCAQDLGAARLFKLLSAKRRAAAAAVGASDADSAPLPGGPRVVVDLKRAFALGGKLGGVSPDSTAFYVGTLRVGGYMAQEFTVVFDTAAGNLVLPSFACSNVTCLERHRYFPSAAASAVIIDHDGHPIMGSATGGQPDFVSLGIAQIDLGLGEIRGGAMRDSVCLGTAVTASGLRPVCLEAGLVAATSMTEMPFRAMPADGMVGLGLDSLTFARPLFSLPRQLAAAMPGMQSMFRLALRGGRGELAFGGLDPLRAVPPAWRPVVRPQDGFWQVQVEFVRVGNTTVDACAGGCRAIVDASASKLGVPSVLAPRLSRALQAVRSDSGGCEGPRLHLSLGGGVAITLHPEDYAGADCGAPEIVPMDLEPSDTFAGVFVLGESVLKRYDVVFDWGLGRLGFSLAALAAEDPAAVLNV